MAEEEAVEEQKSGGIVGLLLGKVGMALAIVMLAAIAAMLVFILVVRPRLMAPEENPVNPNLIPAEVTNHQFEESYASLIMSDPNMPSSTLLYQVSISCSNLVAKELVTAHEDRFIDKIGELHRGRTREEIDDPMVVEGIKKQMVQELNKILRQLHAEPDENTRIIDAHYRKFFASDL